jgi:hypothetical protein
MPLSYLIYPNRNTQKKSMLSWYTLFTYYFIIQKDLVLLKLHQFFKIVFAFLDEIGSDIWLFYMRNNTRMEYWDNFRTYLYHLGWKPVWAYLYPILIFSPALFVSFVFFLENVIFHYIRIFPYIILFLLIPLIIKILLYFLLLTVNSYISELKIYIESKAIDINTNHYQHGWASTCPLAEELKTPELLSYYATLKVLNEDMKDMFELWKRAFVAHKIRLYIVTITLMFWLTSFSYLLYKILTNI